MNVLVYNGPGVSKTSLAHTLSSLRALLLPNYVVQTIGPQSVASDPWPVNCALFVLPGGRDLPYVASFELSSSKITDFVQNGGAFLGLCAGAYYACRRVEWETGTDQEVSGNRPLRFFDGVGRGCTYPGFQYATENGARAVTLEIVDPSSSRNTRVEGLYYNGGGEFVDVERVTNCRSIASYTEGDAAGKSAGVLCNVGAGKALLWAIHPEYPLTLDPAVSAIADTRPDLQTRAAELEAHRWTLMRSTMQLLGLAPTGQNTGNLEPSPQFLYANRSSARALATLRAELSQIPKTGHHHMLEDGTDKFRIYADEASPHTAESQSTSDKSTRDIIIVQEGRDVPTSQPLSFNAHDFFSALDACQKDKALDPRRQYKMGEVLLYGEVVTSTQTLLDKNPKLMSLLPVPLLSLARFQIAGRGRGSNSWLSPPGCLQFSLLLRFPLSSFPTSKIVFIQYLFGLAVVEACRSSAVLGAFGDRVKLKWPNDIYVLTDRDGPKKIGGILVNTSFLGGSVDVIIGCGLNVATPSPLTSLEHLIPPALEKPSLSMENTAAMIMATFDQMWDKFVSVKGSFDPFMDLYLQSDQLVKLTTVDPPIMVRIVGITPDHGLLRTIPETRSYQSFRGENHIDLQPDGNSFDLMAGLIKTKT